MTEKRIIDETTTFITLDMLVDGLLDAGLARGDTLLVHSSMSKIGWISGGAQTVIMALRQVLGEDGTLMMPTHTSANTDPANWQHPSVPQEWWQAIRDSRPAYDPHLTPTREMGVIPELFRNLPGVKRSAHPIGSFAAEGPNADYLLENHNSLSEMFGDESPIGKLYELDGYVLLLGVPHENNTSLHLAEYRSQNLFKVKVKEGTVMLVDGKRQWVDFEMLSIDNDDFNRLGADYERENNIPVHRIGNAEVRFLQQRPLVDYAVQWMYKHRL